jgi:hypothetical protein
LVLIYSGPRWSPETKNHIAAQSGIRVFEAPLNSISDDEAVRQALDFAQSLQIVRDQNNRKQVN